MTTEMGIIVMPILLGLMIWIAFDVDVNTIREWMVWLFVLFILLILLSTFYPQNVCDKRPLSSPSQRTHVIKKVAQPVSNQVKHSQIVKPHQQQGKH